MEHEAAQILLDELRTGELDAELAAEVRAHAEVCEDCRATLSVLEQLTKSVAAHGEALFDEHPEAEELVELAEGGSSLSLTRLAQVRAHLHVCATCHQELQAAQRARKVRSSPVIRLRTGLAGPPVRWALAACIVFALALLGRHVLTTTSADLRTENRSLRERLTMTEQTAELARVQLKVLANWSGPLRHLVVPAALRGPDAGADSILLTSGQPLLPMLVELEPRDRTGRAEELEAQVVATETGRIVWRIEGTAQAWWDTSLGALCLSLPVAELAGGKYRFELRSRSDQRLLRRTEFQLVPWPEAQSAETEDRP